MQITMPKSRSLWPLTPRKETWERSGSFKLASPPASSARAEAAPSKDRAAAVAANLANLQVNLQVRDQAFASQVSIPKSSVDHSFKWHSKAFHRATACRDSQFRHTFSAKRRWARTKSKLFTFHQEEAAARRSETTPIGAGEAPQRRGARAAQNADL